MVFRSRLSCPAATPAPVGDIYAPVYQIELDANGSKIVVEAGQTNLYDKIQSHLEQSKVENVVRRLSVGDTSMLRPEGVYADVTDLPNDLAGMQNLILRIKSEFDQLPLDVRKAYDFSAEKYVADYGSDEWRKVMGIVQSADSAVPSAAGQVVQSADKEAVKNAE